MIRAGELLSGTALRVGEERDRITVEHAKQMIWPADQLSKVGKKFEQYAEVKQSV